MEMTPNRPEIETLFTEVKRRLLEKTERKAKSEKVFKAKIRKKLQIRRENHRKNKLFRRFNVKFLNKSTRKAASVNADDRFIARFFDYAIPIEPTYKDAMNAEDKYFHPIFSKLQIFKRITSITYTYNDNEYVYKIEERKPFKNVITNLNSFISKELLLYLETSKCKHANMQNTKLLNSFSILSNSLIYEKSFYNCFNSKDTQLFQTRQEIKKQRKSMQNVIHVIDKLMYELKDLPYFKITEKSSLDHAGGHLISLAHNKQMSDLIGVSEPKLNGELEGFEVFSNLKTSNWVHYYLLIMTFKTDAKAKELMLYKDLIKLYDCNGKEIVGTVHLYKNRAFVDQVYVNEIYFVQNQEKNFDKIPNY